jgi:hypothetical protein
MIFLKYKKNCWSSKRKIIEHKEEGIRKLIKMENPENDANTILRE